MFNQIMEILKFTVDLKNRFIVKYIYGDNSSCFFGNNEDVLWGFKQYEIIIKMENYKTEESSIYVVDMYLGSEWFSAHGDRDKVVSELNDRIVSYFSNLAYKKGIDYEY